MPEFSYHKSLKYTDYDAIYEQCSGPGGLQLAEFMAEKMRLSEGKKLLDIGANWGYQTCFLAKEYGVFAVGIDPWDDRKRGNPKVDYLQENAIKWNVVDSVLGIKSGVPETNFASGSFDYVYSTNALEMVRIGQGTEEYCHCLNEIYRVLKPGGIFGIGEPMHLDVSIPPDLAPHVSYGDYPWKDCLRSLEETVKLVRKAGFKIEEAEYSPHARQWWMSFVEHDPYCRQNPQEDPKTLEIDAGRWASYGYIISKKTDRID